MNTLQRNITLLALRNLQTWLRSLPNQHLSMAHFLHGAIADVLYDGIEGDGLFPPVLVKEIDAICEEINK